MIKDTTVPTKRTPIGVSGTKHYSGIIRTNEYNNSLIGLQGLRQYEIMRRSDTTIHAMLMLAKYPILGIDWYVAPASNDDKDVWIANFINRELTDRNVSTFKLIYDLLLMLDFGFSVCEKTYEPCTYDGKQLIGIKEIALRKQITLHKWELENGKPGFWQQVDGANYQIPWAKILHVANDMEGEDLEGISLLRYCYRDWYIKDGFIKINAIAGEKQALGVPVLTFPAGIAEGEKDTARDIIRQMRANEESYLEVPQGAGIEMLDMKINGQKDLIPSIKYHDRQILQPILAGFFDLGSTSGSGSRAVGEEQAKYYFMGLQAVAGRLQEAIQKQVVQQLCDLNFTELPNGYPQLKHGDLRQSDISILAESIKGLTDSKHITPDVNTENYLRSSLSLPEIPEEIVEKRTKLEKERVIDVVDDGEKPAVDDNKNDKQLEKDKEDKKQASIKAARQAQRGLIDVLLG